MRITTCSYMNNGLTDLMSPLAITDVTEFISKNETRRFPPIVKAALFCALKCNQLSGHSPLDAIITGTGKGAVNSIEKFQSDIIDFHESALNPAVFIQSTYNTIGGFIALKLNAAVHNSTHVNMNQTVTNVLAECQNLLESGYQKILIGFFDEMTDFDQVLYDKCGWLYSAGYFSAPIKWNNTAAFFMVESNEAYGKNISYYNFITADHLQDEIENLDSQQFLNGEVFFISGDNNEWEWENLYQPLVNKINFKQIIHFKRIYGESPTSSATAMAIAYDSLSKAGEKAFILNRFFDLGIEIILLEYI